MNTLCWKYVSNPAVLAKGYYLWKSKGGKWQVTTTLEPPKPESGYYDLLTLLKLKGI